MGPHLLFPQSNKHDDYLHESCYGNLSEVYLKFSSLGKYKQGQLIKTTIHSKGYIIEDML